MSNEIYKPKIILDLSGGKDSLFMFLNHLDKNIPFDTVFTVSLEIENPIETRVKQSIKNRCYSSGIPFVEVTPKVSYQELYDRYGFLPSPKMPWLWCQRCYKQPIIRELDYNDKKLGFNNFHRIGFCADEKQRFYKNNFELGNYPLASWGIDESTVLEWAKHIDLFDGWYENFPRLGCTMCPYRKSDEIEWLLKKGYDVYSLDNGVNFNHYGNGEII